MCLVWCSLNLCTLLASIFKRISRIEVSNSINWRSLDLMKFKVMQTLSWKHEHFMSNQSLAGCFEYKSSNDQLSSSKLQPKSETRNYPQNHNSMFPIRFYNIWHKWFKLNQSDHIKRLDPNLNPTQPYSIMSQSDMGDQIQMASLGQTKPKV